MEVRVGIFVRYDPKLVLFFRFVLFCTGIISFQQKIY